MILIILLAFMMAPVFGVPSFTVLPKAVTDGDSVKISFTVSQYTDVTVEVINAKDSSIVCELGSGLLGKNPPHPFQPNSLSQTVVWDKKDNYGKSFTGSWDVRVSLAMFADLDRIYNNDTRNVLQSLAPKAMGVDSLGNLYVLAAEWFRGTGTKLVVFSRTGEYLRTIAPYPGNLPEERLSGFGRITQPDGKITPVIYQGMDGVLHPEFFNPVAHTMAVTSDGKIVISNSIATVQWYGIQTSKRRLLILGTDGSCPRDTIYGPQIDTVKRQGGIDVAVTPDNKTVYATSVGVDVYMLTEDKRSRHVIYKSPLNSTAQAEIFLGKLDQPGTGNGEFNQPEGIAVDKSGNIYIADYGNNRISIYNAAGSIVKHVSSWRPKFIQVNRKTGEFFVLSYITDTTNPVILKKYSALPNTDSITAKQFTRIAPTSVIPVMALDYFADKPIIWIGPLDYVESTIYGFVDNGSLLDAHNVTIAKKQPDAWAAVKIHGPGYLTVSPDESFLYSGCNNWARVDLKSGAITQTNIKGNELIFAQDTTLYAYSKGGYKDSIALRYDRNGNSIPFKNGQNELSVGPTEFYSGVGSKGLAILPNGNLIIPNTGLTRSDTIKYYVWDMNICKAVDTLPIEMPHAAAGFRADRFGNLYFACNVKPKGVAYPAGIESGFLPDPSVVSFYQYPFAHLNYYMFGIGCLLKFPQKAKGIHEHIAGKISAVPNGTLDDVNVPEDQVNGIYYSHYKVEGAKWQHLGISHCPSPWRSRGDPGCFCFTPRFSIDGHGRIFYPEAYRFNVVVIDNNKNELLRFGDYGNRDQQGKFGSVPSPDIPLTAPWYVEKVNNSIYISDAVSRRILKVKLRYQTSATLNGAVIAERGNLPVAAAVNVYPMPFNPIVNIALSLPESKIVSMTILDTRGKLVKTFNQKMHNAGRVEYVWNGVDQAGHKVGAGLYFANVNIGTQRFQKSLLLVK